MHLPVKGIFLLRLLFMITLPNLPLDDNNIFDNPPPHCLARFDIFPHCHHYQLISILSEHSFSLAHRFTIWNLNINLDVSKNAKRNVEFIIIGVVFSSKGDAQKFFSTPKFPEHPLENMRLVSLHSGLKKVSKHTSCSLLNTVSVSKQRAKHFYSTFIWKF